MVFTVGMEVQQRHEFIGTRFGFAVCCSFVIFVNLLTFNKGRQSESINHDEILFTLYFKSVKKTMIYPTRNNMLRITMHYKQAYTLILYFPSYLVPSVLIHRTLKLYFSIRNIQ